jgi:hypothetical protein
MCAGQHLAQALTGQQEQHTSLPAALVTQETLEATANLMYDRNRPLKEPAKTSIMYPCMPPLS